MQAGKKRQVEENTQHSETAQQGTVMVSWEPQSGQRLPEVGLPGVIRLIFIMLSFCCGLMWFRVEAGQHFTNEPEMR